MAVIEVIKSPADSLLALAINLHIVPLLSVKKQCVDIVRKLGQGYPSPSPSKKRRRKRRKNEC